MARRDRADAPGAWHHVMDRGIARRIVFGDRREARALLALLALEVRRREIEVHAYCVMGTHFHALIRSLTGNLSSAMRRVLNRFVRWYNRKHRRDGPLFRARFQSKRVECLRYRGHLVSYIDQNPVRAGVCRDGAAHEFGSARAWHTGRFPPWLSRDWIDGVLAPWRAGGMSRADAYDRVFARSRSSSRTAWVERAIASPAMTRHELSLFESAPARVREWMCRKARLADGGRLGAPLVDLPSLSGAFAEREPILARLRLVDENPRIDARTILHTALIRDLCGLRVAEVAAVLSVSESTVVRRRRQHRVELGRNPKYAEAGGDVARRALEIFRNRVWELPRPGFG